MKLALLFLWITLLPAQALASEVELCQPGYFARLTQRYVSSLVARAPSRSPISDAVRKAAEGKFAFRRLKGRVSSDSWLEWRELGESERELLASLHRLKANERAELIPIVKNAQAESLEAKQLRRLMLLGLYERGSWASLSASIGEGGLYAHLAAHYLPALERGLPPELREEFLEALGARYHSFTKERQFRYADHAPKRLADFYFKRVFRGDELIERELKNGRSSQEAFRAYISEVQAYISNTDHYTADQALGMMEAARKALQKAGRGPAGEEPALWIGGSLANGRATFMESDIDIGFKELSPQLKAEIEKSVKSYAAALNPQAKIHAGFKPGLDAAFWTKLHPVTFRIRASGIDMVVARPDGQMLISPMR